MKSQINLILWTIALTVLIWVYADRSGYSTRELGPVMVKIAPPPDAVNPYVVRVPDEEPERQNFVSVSLRVSGPKAQIDRLEREIQNQLLDLQVALQDKPPLGTIEYDLAGALGDNPELRRRGLVLQSVEPAMVMIEVDRRREIEIGLKFDAGRFEKLLDSDPLANPEQVTARVLESRLQETTPPETVTVPIEEYIEQARERGAGRQGEPIQLRVPLRSGLLGLNAGFVPEQVSVTLRMKQVTEIERITVRPLKLMIGVMDFCDKYNVEFRDTTKAYLTQVIWVRVPMEKTGRLDPDSVNAYIEINDEHLPENRVGAATEPVDVGWIEAPVRFDFPPEFDDVVIDRQQQETVAFRVIPKNPAAGQ